MLTNVNSVLSITPTAEPSYSAPSDLTAQLLSALSATSQGTQSQLENIAEQALFIQALLSISSQLASREQAMGAAPTANDIRTAIKNGESVAALFAADPESLGASLADAQYLYASLQAQGLAFDAQLRYPVVQISSVNGKDKASLVWLSASQREALNKYPDSVEKDYAGYPAKVQEEDEKAIRYVLLDDHANLRIQPDALKDVGGTVSLLISQGTTDVSALRAKLAAALGSLGELLNFFANLLAEQKNDDVERQTNKNEQTAKDDEDRRKLLARLKLLIDIALALQDSNSVASNNASIDPRKKNENYKLV